MPARTKALTDEDRVLWSKVARTATPLKGRAVVIDDPADTRPRDERPHPGNEPARPPASAPLRHGPPAAKPSRPAIDRPTRDKLKKGRVAIDGSVDLHGMTQAAAHALLLGFLRRGYAEGRRHVLVITGKGASFGSEGVLRRAVPEWFATQPFRPLVSGWSDAARNHGGSGALYIRIARNPAFHPA